MEPQVKVAWVLRVETSSQTGAPILEFLKIFIYLAASHLSCSKWDLVPWPGTEPKPRALGAWSLNHWTTREVPDFFFFFCMKNQLLCQITESQQFNCYCSSIALTNIPAKPLGEKIEDRWTFDVRGKNWHWLGPTAVGSQRQLRSLEFWEVKLQERQTSPLCHFAWGEHLLK